MGFELRFGADVTEDLSWLATTLGPSYTLMQLKCSTTSLNSVLTLSFGLLPNLLLQSGHCIVLTVPGLGDAALAEVVSTRSGDGLIELTQTD